MRENFIKQIEMVLASYGFSKTGNIFERIQYFTQPGQRMVINGQQINQPPQQIEVKHSVTEIGDGYCSNKDDTNKQEFTEFEFKIFVKDQLNAELVSIYYWDDIDSFKNDLINILKV